MRLGGAQRVQVDVRVIATTSKDLQAEIGAGRFREDLYYRLAVVPLRVAPLRERREDIPGLARTFLARSAHDLGVEAKRLSDAAMDRLMRFEFPGNVRQLENLCHWLTVMAPAQLIEPKDLPPEVQADHAPPRPATPEGPARSVGSAPPDSPSPAVPVGGLAVDAWLVQLAQEARRLLEAGVPDVWGHLTRQFEGRLIHVALENTRGRRIEAAQKLGIGRNTITRKIQELGLDE
jgi:two-component system nitrogen regulation response regulator GlnG